MGLRKKLSELTKYYFTLVIIPHTSAKIKKISFSFNFMVFTLCLWTTLTVWVTYTNVKYTGYVSDKIGCRIIEKKFEALTKEEKGCREFIEEVQVRDGGVRKILGINGTAQANDNSVLGGPESSDESYLEKSMGRKIHELEAKELKHRIVTLNNELRQRLHSADEINKNIHYQKKAYCATPNVLPCEGRFLKNYGYRVHPINGYYEFHKGIDISNARGTPICATADGVVTAADWAGGYGKLVVLDHGYGYQTRFAHLSRILVSVGQKVKRGNKVGLMGATGISTCPHLHYEVRYCDTPMNPFIFLRKDVYFSLRK
jgi:murein DD-endopeptidase MepM/ murein hydrolase activator NlpD